VKKVTSLTLAFSFLVMSYTGIMLFIVPQGKVAYWTNWTLLGLSKEQYGAIHSTSMVVFLLFGILHVYYNWKPIVSYLKTKTSGTLFSSKEFFIALLINIAFVSGTLAEVKPFSSFMAMGEKIKDNWAKSMGEPPYGHAEESSLKALCKNIDVDLEEAINLLAQKGIKIQSPMQTLKAIAQEQKMSPSEIYEIIKPKGAQPKQTQSTIPNLGRKTLQELSSMQKISLQKSIEYLKSQGVLEVSEESKMKSLSGSLDMTPMELLEVLEKL
jgi:hypothetical protein